MAVWNGGLQRRPVAAEVAPGVHEVVQRVEEQPEVVVRGKLLGSQGALLVGAAVAAGPTTVLVLSECSLGDAGATALGSALLSSTCRVVHLDISGNDIVVLDEGFCNGVAAGRLLGLNVANNPLLASSVERLCTSIAGPTSSVQDLDLSGVQAAGRVQESVASASGRVEVLRLGYTCTAVLPSANAVHSAALQALDLTSASIGESECRTLAAHLSAFPFLSHLCLRHNAVTPSALRTLAPSLAAVPTLRELSLAANPLTGVSASQRRYNEKGVVALAAAVLHHPCLQAIDLSACNLALGTRPFYDGVDHGGIALLCDSVKRNVSMKTIHLSFNRFNAATVTHLKRVAGGKCPFKEGPSGIALVVSPSSAVHYGHYFTEPPQQLQYG